MMLSASDHRGPDSAGHWNHQDFSFGATRLAILDFKEGQQPFHSLNGRYTAICNGELYNWRDLRIQLEECGHRFRTRCDCEILPAAFEEWGVSLPEKLNGMFALAIYDALENSLFLARDRCGQKPLYYNTRGAFRFASEVKALVAGGLPLAPDSSQLATWLLLRYLPEPATLFEGVVTLPSAHWMTVTSEGITQLERYWQPPPARLSIPTGTKPESSLDSLDGLTRSAVALAHHSEVPIAAYLSGGVDSALLAHYLKDLGADFQTLSIGFGSASDETAAASSTAQHLALPHHSLHLGPDSLSDLPRVIHQMDRPIGDALILAFDHLAQQTSAMGCKVALGGEGPDEHFAGYSFQKAFLTAQKLGPLGRPLAAAAIKHLPTTLLDNLARFPAALGPEGRQKTARYLRNYSSLSFFQRATGLHTLFEPHEITALLHPDLRLLQKAHPLTQATSLDSSLHDLLALQYQHWLPDWSLIRQDKNTMAHSVEYRAPFLDHRLIDFAFQLPDSEKLHRGTDKAIWRRLAARHLPSTITNRPKIPFYLPLEQPAWRKPLIAMAREILAPTELSKHSWLNPAAIEPLFSATTFLPLKQLAALIILQIWLSSFS